MVSCIMSNPRPPHMVNDLLLFIIDKCNAGISLG